MGVLPLTLSWAALGKMGFVRDLIVGCVMNSSVNISFPNLICSSICWFWCPTFWVQFNALYIDCSRHTTMVIFIIFGGGKMERVLLPIVEHHNVNSSLGHAFVLSIVLAHENLKEWYNENYIIPLMYELSAKSVATACDYLDAYACSNIGVYKDIFVQNGYSYDFINTNNLIQVIKSFLHKSLYVMVMVDEFYLPNCRMGGKTHFLHEVLVFGYDDQSHSLLMLGFNKKGVYGIIEHSYSDLLNSYEKAKSCSVHGDVEWAHENRIITFQLSKPEFCYTYDKRVIISSIKRYLNPYLTNKDRYRLYSPAIKKIYVGIECYEILLNKISSSLDVFMLANLLQESKCIMLEHLTLFSITDEQKNIYMTDVLELTKKIRFISLKRKYIVVDEQKNAIDSLLRQLITQLMENEKLFLSNFCKYYE